MLISYKRYKPIHFYLFLVVIWLFCFYEFNHDGNDE